MAQRQPDADFSSDDDTDPESCFDTENEDSDHNTDPTDTDTDVELDDSDVLWLVKQDNVHPPEYYINQEDEFDEAEFDTEDYGKNSLTLFNVIKDRWYRYCKYVGKNPDRSIRAITLPLLNSFFDWVLDQRRGKGGRRVCGIKSSSTLGTYWKIFRLIYEEANDSKIHRKLNRKMHRVLRKLAKKHKLSNKKREKMAVDVEDLVGILQINLTTTKKKYGHGRHRIQLALFHHLAGFSANRPQAVLDLCYRHIVVSLLRDPDGGPHRILLEFTYEFTKQFLGMKDANTFPVPEIIFDPSLLLSPHVFLLGLLFADKAFAAPNLTSAEQLSKLDIRPGTNQLSLPLKRSMDNIPIFRKSITTTYGTEISPDEPLPYTTLLPLVKTLGVLTGFLHIHRPYNLRYGAANAFNKSGDISDALQNMMMQHADMRTFIQHYLKRQVTADTAAIVRGLEPQYELMRAACRMSRWINPDRPQELTEEESLSVNNDPYIRQLLAQREKLKFRFKREATKQPVYKLLGRDIINERQRKRSSYLKQVQGKWDEEHPVEEIELQLSGLKFTDDVKTTLDLSDEMPPAQRRLVETVMTLPGTTLEEEFCRRNAAINAVAAYCEFEEGGPVRGRKPASKKSLLPPLNADPQVIAAIAEEQALSAAMLSVFKEHRPLICFVCLGRKSLPFEKRVYKFASPGDLTKHFKRKHLSHIKEGQRPECKICPMQLEHKMHFQRHAQEIHGTVS